MRRVTGVTRELSAALLLSLATCAAPPSLDERGEEAARVVLDFYAHVAAGDCPSASALATKLSPEHCRALFEELSQAGARPEVVEATVDGRDPQRLLLTVEHVGPEPLLVHVVEGAGGRLQVAVGS